jgi:glycosyltransferase involved in cell wall biosynthesis
MSEGRSLEPTYSVLVPAYRTEAFIAELVESVIAQTRTDWELIVVDDASDDGVSERVRPYLGDPRIRLIRNERNRGVSSSRNVAARTARGRFLSFIDSDDVLRSDFLEQISAVIEPLQNPGIVGCISGLIDEAGEHVAAAGKVLPEPFTSSDPEDTLLDLLRGPHDLNGMTIPRSVFEQIGEFDENIWMGEDLEIWVRIAVTGRAVRVIREPIHFYRLHQSSVTGAKGRIIELSEAHLKTLSLIAQRIPLTSDRRRALDQHEQRAEAGLARARYRKAVREGQVKLARQSAGRLLRLRPSPRAVAMLMATAIPHSILLRLYEADRRRRGLGPTE